MPAVFKPAGRTKYRFEYRDAAGQLKTYATGVSDKRAAEQIMRDVIRRIEREVAGLPVVAQEQRKAPVSTLIHQYVSEMQRLNFSTRHIRQTELSLTRAFAETSTETLAAFRLERFANWLSAIPRSPRHHNAFRAAINTFFKFCCAMGYAEANPLEHFKAFPAKKVRPRRAYTLDEFITLCKHPSRGHVYKVAGLSGFRRSELAKMQKQDLNPYATIPLWSPRAQITKAKRADQAPILPDLLPLIRELWNALPEPTSRLFSFIPQTRTLYLDQQELGIPQKDSQGRIADFHSFRYFFCTLLAKSLPIHKVQGFMRHANVQITSQTYMDLGLKDLWAEAQEIPSFLPQATEPPRTLPLSLPG